MDRPNENGWRTGPTPKAEDTRDEQGRFRKGKSGNLKGRPLKKQRAATSRQFADDVLKELEKPVMDEDSGRKVSRQQALIARLIGDALASSDIGTKLRVLNLAQKALAAHGQNNRDVEVLEDFERELSARSRFSQRDLDRALNPFRKKTRPR